jgi:hypothetical protein
MAKGELQVGVTEVQVLHLLRILIRRFLVLVLWHERFQAEHMEVVREVTEFIIRLQLWSLSGQMGREKRKTFVFSCFGTILNLR